MQWNEKRQVEIKLALGERAASLVEEGMVVGLGSGTTANFFIQSLIVRVQRGLKIRALASSIASLKLAQEGNIPLADINKVERIDLTVDGADEVDPKMRMIKGKGGAHVREKILAFSSKKLLVIIDESKLVTTLGACGLPVEILPFAEKATIARLMERGYRGSLRMKEGKTFISDNGNFIFDVQTPSLFTDPEKSHFEIISVPGVVETGFFFNLATSVLIGYSDERGNCKTRFAWENR